MSAPTLPDLDTIAPLAARRETFADFERSCAADFPAFNSRFRTLTLDHLDDPGPEYESLIDGWLSTGDKSVIGGPSQSGKSFFAIHAGMCIATDRPFFCARVKPGLVIYIAGEGARGVKKRLRAWRKHFGVEFSRETPFVLIQSPVDLYKQEGGDTEPLLQEIAGIQKLFPGIPIRLVVIDTLATAAIGAEENSSRDMGLVMLNVQKISSRTGAHVALVHHMNAGGDKLRGSTAIYANIDQAIYITRNEATKVRTARMGKHKDEEASTNIQFELMSVELGTDANGRPVTSCVCLPVGEKEAIRKVEEAKGTRLSDGEIVFMRALFAAERKHGRPVPPGMQGPSDKVRSIVPYVEMRRAYGQFNPPEDDADEVVSAEDKAKSAERRIAALKKQVQRHRQALVSRGVISFGQYLDPSDTAPTAKPEWFVWWTGGALRAFPWTIPREDPSPRPEDTVAHDPDLDSANF